MKRSVSILALLTVVLGTGVSARAAEFKVGYVDLQRALNESAEGKKAKASFKEEVDRLEKQLRGKKDELDQLKTELEKKAVVMREEERRKLEGDFAHKQLDLRRRFEDSQAQLQKRDAELTGVILKRLQIIIKDIGDKEGYDLVLELGGSSVLYFKKGDDLTERVLERFNKGE